MGNWVNWLLVIGGIIFVIVELALGAMTGFDLALVGASTTRLRKTRSTSYPPTPAW